MLTKPTLRTRICTKVLHSPLNTHFAQFELDEGELLLLHCVSIRERE
jgi:hypothetical protein